MSDLQQKGARALVSATVASVVLLAAACGGDDAPDDAAQQSPAAGSTITALTEQGTPVDVHAPPVVLESGGRSVESARAAFACTAADGPVRVDTNNDRPEQYLSVAPGAPFAVVVGGPAPGSVISVLVIDDIGIRTLARLNSSPLPSPASFTPLLEPGRYRLAVTAQAGDCKLTDWFGIEIAAQ